MIKRIIIAVPNIRHYREMLMGHFPALFSLQFLFLIVIICYEICNAHSKHLNHGYDTNSPFWEADSCSAGQ